MRLHKSAAIWAAMVSVLICGLLGGPARVYAQVTGEVNLDLAKPEPLRNVLDIISEQVPGFQYVIQDPTLNPNVTFVLRDMEVNQALRLILNSVGATYRLDQGTYVVDRQPVAPRPIGPTAMPGMTPVRTPPVAPGVGGGVTAPGGATTGDTTDEDMIVRRIRVQHADPTDIALMFGGDVIPSGMGMMSRGGGGMGGGWGGGGWGGGGWGGGGGGWGGGGWGGGGWGGGGRGGWGGGGWGGGGRGGLGGGGWGGRSTYGGGSWGGRTNIGGWGGRNNTRGGRNTGWGW